MTALQVLRVAWGGAIWGIDHHDGAWFAGPFELKGHERQIRVWQEQVA